jgi:hypothetical protein
MDYVSTFQTPRSQRPSDDGLRFRQYDLSVLAMMDYVSTFQAAQSQRPSDGGPRFRPHGLSVLAMMTHVSDRTATGDGINGITLEKLPSGQRNSLSFM